jgi:hypothetical protein
MILILSYWKRKHKSNQEKNHQSKRRQNRPGLAYTQLPAVTAAAAAAEEEEDYDYNNDNMVTNFMRRK